MPSDSAPETERELVRLARTDRVAFGALYDRYLPSIHAYCYRRLGTQEMAEDATAIVFTKALSAIHRFQVDGSSFRAWLFTIAHNTTIDELRDRRWTSHMVPDAESAFETDDPGPEELAIVAADLARLRELLSQLPADQARVVELRLAGLSDQEIAQVVECSHGAVRVSIHRALKRLRFLMDPEEGIDV